VQTGAIGGPQASENWFYSSCSAIRVETVNALKIYQRFGSIPTLEH
jgi:hypothetical protein